MRCIILNLEAPILSFGGVAIDNHGVTRKFPALSMLTGLFANALGWERTDHKKLQALQTRLDFAARWNTDDPEQIVDFQTAQLQKKDVAWVTRYGMVGRDGGHNTYKSPHIRYRSYYPDASLTVLCSLKNIEEPVLGGLSLEDLGQALQFPARPLFIGRKSCIPSAQMFAGYKESKTLLTALASIEHCCNDFWAIWSADEVGEESICKPLTDERNWTTGLHCGSRKVCEGRIKVRV